MSAKPDLPGDLLTLARQDLVAAEALDRDERVSDSSVGFHAQQAVEKALKAAIASRGLEFPLLTILASSCSSPRTPPQVSVASKRESRRRQNGSVTACGVDQGANPRTPCSRRNCSELRDV
jgi:hypothetical protein